MLLEALRNSVVEVESEVSTEGAGPATAFLMVNVES